MRINIIRTHGDKLDPPKRLGSVFTTGYSESQAKKAIAASWESFDHDGDFLKYLVEEHDGFFSIIDEKEIDVEVGDDE